MPVVHASPVVEERNVDELMGRGTPQKNVVPLLLVLQLAVGEEGGDELDALTIVFRFELVRVDDDGVAFLWRMDGGSLLTVKLPHGRPPDSCRRGGIALAGMLVPLRSRVRWFGRWARCLLVSSPSLASRYRHATAPDPPRDRAESPPGFAAASLPAPQ